MGTCTGSLFPNSSLPDTSNTRCEATMLDLLHSISRDSGKSRIFLDLYPPEMKETIKFCMVLLLYFYS